MKLCTQIIGDCWYDGKKLRNTRLKHGDDAACRCDEGEDDRGLGMQMMRNYDEDMAEIPWSTGPELEANHCAEPWRRAMAQRTRHETWWFIRCGNGRVDGVKNWRQLGLMKNEKNASTGKTRKRAKAGGQR